MVAGCFLDRSIDAVLFSAVVKKNCNFKGSWRGTSGCGVPAIIILIFFFFFFLRGKREQEQRLHGKGICIEQIWFTACHVHVLEVV